MTGPGAVARRVVRLRSDEAHVWVARPEEAVLLGPLSVDELHRWSRIRPLQSRRAYAAAHALVRHSLSWCAPWVPPEGWRLAADRPHGRPEVTEPPMLEQIRVNLSHAEGLVAVVVTLGTACGVDVERLPNSGTARRLASRVLADTELAAWQRLPEVSRADRFCQLWTLKEATTKALGLGLSMAFDSVAFDVDARGKVARTNPEPGWSVTSWRPTEHHHLSVAVHAPEVEFVRHHLPEETRA